MGLNSKPLQEFLRDGLSGLNLPMDHDQSTHQKAGKSSKTASATKRTVKRSNGKTPKYGNKKTVVDGITFDSKKEAMRYEGLKIAQDLGYISNLRLQVPFELAPSVRIYGRKRSPLRYVADFVYFRGGNRVVEDSKGVRTEGYRIKRHLMMSVHGIEIYET